MTNLISLSEGVWMQKDRVFPTEDQKKVLSSTNSGDTAAKNDILSLIKSGNTANPADVSKAILAYNLKKPALVNPTDVYKFIASAVTIDGDTVTGFINYMMNGVINKITF